MDNLSTRGYRRLMREVLDAALPTCVYLFTDWRMWIETFDCVEDVGLQVRAMIVWDKIVPGLGSPWRNQHELILYAVRESPPSHWGPGNVRSHARCTVKQHPTEKPLPLLHDLLGMVGETSEVLDPFMGSGSTLRAAKDLGRNAVGIEIEERYCEIAAERCRQEALFFV